MIPSLSSTSTSTLTPLQTLHNRDHRLLMCRPRYFTVQTGGTYRTPTASTSGRQDFNIELRTFATVEQAGMLGKSGYLAERASSPERVVESAYSEEGGTKKGLVKQLVEHGLRWVSGLVPGCVGRDVQSDD
jgi:hypothetical protein